MSKQARLGCTQEMWGCMLVTWVNKPARISKKQVAVRIRSSGPDWIEIISKNLQEKSGSMQEKWENTQVTWDCRLEMWESTPAKNNQE